METLSIPGSDLQKQQEEVPLSSSKQKFQKQMFLFEKESEGEMEAPLLFSKPKQTTIEHLVLEYLMKKKLITDDLRNSFIKQHI